MSTMKSRTLPPLMRLTDVAAERLRALYECDNSGRKLRVSVAQKGCSGLTYDLSWVDAPAATDEVVTDNGVTVLVDRKASLFLIGSVMDFHTSQLTSGFTFANPNEKGRCGCGESFHV